MKICTKCGGVGPFPKDKQNKSGFSSWCKKCHAEATAKYRQKYPEKTKKAIRQWKEMNKEWVQNYNSEWHRNHPKYGSNYYMEHSKERKMYTHIWQIQNSEKIKIYNSCRRTRFTSAGKRFTIHQWEELKLDYGYCCVYCNNQTDELSPDHIIPISRGGTNDISNIVPACKSCNASKNDTPLLLWMYKRASK